MPFTAEPSNLRHRDGAQASTTNIQVFFVRTGALRKARRDASPQTKKGPPFLETAAPLGVMAPSIPPGRAGQWPTLEGKRSDKYGGFRRLLRASASFRASWPVPVFFPLPRSIPPSEVTLLAASQNNCNLRSKESAVECGLTPQHLAFSGGPFYGRLTIERVEILSSLLNSST